MNDDMPIKYLINEDGKPFEPSEITSLTLALDSLSDTDRDNYRNNNASEIAKHSSPKSLIVSGPGTGKSYLFLNKINNWFSNNGEAVVLVTSFVRKLVADLQKDINSDKKLSKKQKGNVTATTLHKFARSIVEKNHGTSQYQFKPHFRIIGEFWKDVVWNDVLAFFPNLNTGDFSWKMFEKQLHSNQFDTLQDWLNVKYKYFELCKFYNASGFADLILRAKGALDENPSLNKNQYFIVDEYQDFNLAEDSFINKLTSNAKGLLIVGDDEQVLYENLKSGKAELIRNKYKDESIINALLPFCGRCSTYITKATSHFIQQCRDNDSIQKIYLPIKTSDGNPKVQVVACATPSTAVDYIEKFITDNKTEIDDRKNKLESGDKKDAFLLILTPAKKLKYLGKAKEKLLELVSKYQAENRSFSDDYYKVLAYYSLSNYTNNNFAFRKAIYYEGISDDIAHTIIENALNNNQDFCNSNTTEISTIITKCNSVKAIIESSQNVDQKIDSLSALITITDKDKLKIEVNIKNIGQDQVFTIEHEEEEEAELEEIEIKRMGAVELMTIVGSKGLSADHVVIIGFDNINMAPVTKNAFYVAMTRARKGLHLLTSLKSGGSQNTHRFLDWLPDSDIEFYKYTKSSRSKIPFSNRVDFFQYFSSLNHNRRRGNLSG